MNIIIASDHAGTELKKIIINYFTEIKFIDCETNNQNSLDYPDVAQNLCKKFLEGNINFGILICGSGVGMSVAANRFKNIRAALCFEEKIATLSREHNDANILCLGARFISNQKAISIIKAFISKNFSGERHEIRVKKIDQNL
jgi:RpiB/LacA/LacB family sugar-phosphate isomerase